MVLKDGDIVVSGLAYVTEMFNAYFANAASTIGLDDEIVWEEDAPAKHSKHPSMPLLVAQHSSFMIQVCTCVPSLL